MRLPTTTSLYGRIFAIFWFTMFLVLLAVLALPHLDPRKAKTIPAPQLAKLEEARDHIEQRFAQFDHLEPILRRLEVKRHKPDEHKHHKFYITDQAGNIFTSHLGSDRRAQDRRPPDRRTKALQNFIANQEGHQPMQRLYGRLMIAGPLPITLANQELYLYVGARWHRPPPLLLRLFDHPFQLLLAVMAVSTPLLLWLAWALSQPARRLERAAQRVAKGDFEIDPELERKGTSEFRQAGASFNQMVQGVNEMISGQQRLLSDISHELRSPLTRLRMANALAIRKQGESSELHRIDTEAQRLEQMIGDLLALSRIQVDSHQDKAQHTLEQLWQDLLLDAQFEAEHHGKRLTFTPLPQGQIQGNHKLLMSALDNVVRNGIYYGKDRTEVTFSIRDAVLTIQVDDNGEGVEEEELDAIFRPFYRVSTARDRHTGGTGLGLAITDSAVRQHQGTLTASRSSLGGLCVTITLQLDV